MKNILGLVAGATLVAAACGGSSAKRDDGGSRSGSAGEAGDDAGGIGGAGASGRGGTAGIGAKGGTGGIGAKGGTGGIGAKGGMGAQGGTAGGADCTSDPSALDGLSFTVNLPGNGSGECCPEIPGATVFHFESSATGLEVVVGSEGQAFRGSVTSDGPWLTVEPGLRVRDGGNPYAWDVNNGITVENLSLCFHPPRDSSPNLDGQGTLRVVRNGDDYLNEFDADVAFTGARWDDTLPALPASQTLDPLDPADVLVSEPLELGAVAALDDAAQTPLTPLEQAGTVVAFHVSAILPLDFEARIGVDARDLQGNKLEPGCVIRTDADPGVQALDGFESELKVVDYGSSPAEIVTDDRVLEGSQSLEVPGGGSTLLHLERPSASAKHVRFDLKADRRLSMVPANFIVRAGVVGGREIVTQEFPATRPGSADGSAGAAGAGGEGGAGLGPNGVMAVDLELSETGADVLLEISAPFIEASASTDVGAIIDWLRIE